MNCELARFELMEYARRGGEMPAELRDHVAGCDGCRSRWQAEHDLSSHLAALRMVGIPEGHEWGKAVLLREFDRHRRHVRQVRWMWAMSTAALLAISVFTVRDIRARHDETAAVTAPPAAARTFTPRDYPQEAFAPAEEAGEEGFIKLPFALPPVPGETFGIVRTQLDPAQLVGMGVRVDPSWSGSVEADVLVGQDGLAQAVRLSNDDDGAADGSAQGY
ncbi:MAG TPA: hypothetical protein VHA14_07035 [Bryobacteraceae bacterium]|nr:hypothetical protein [Bryobacteraceae bacterium]